MAEDESYHRTKQFTNGDAYTGTWSHSGLPDGEGKYTWPDGSSYEGSWKEGVRHGIGKYTWPSGATYHGEWRDGCMTGVGTWESPDGLSRYQGGWLRDAKHGLGRQVYASGDVYEGLWKLGHPGGPGRYVYSDGNEYDGEWRGGRMHGQGTFVWRSGERYDGEWKEGRMDGAGLFTAADCSTFDGRWRRGRKHGVGVFRPGLMSPYPLHHAGGSGGGTYDGAGGAGGTGPAAGLSRKSMAGAGRRSSGGGGGGASSRTGILQMSLSVGSVTSAMDPSAATANGGGGGGGGGGASLLVAGLGAAAGSPDGRGKPLGQMGNGVEHSERSTSEGPHHHHHHLQHDPASQPSNAERAPGAAAAAAAVAGWASTNGHSTATPFGAAGGAAPPPAGEDGWVSSGHGAVAVAAPVLPMAAPPAAPWRGRSASGVLEGTSIKAGGAGAAAAATTSAGASKLAFLRVYDKGRLLRETALAADELDTLLPGGLVRAGGRGRLARDDRGANPTGHLLRMLRGGGMWSRPHRPPAAAAAASPLGPRLGDPVTRAHPSYSLMVALQLGIRYSVGRISHEPLPRNTSSDEYGLRVQQEFPRNGSEMTPVHPGEDFTWSDYAPMTFRRLRESFGVDASTYMLSLCSDHSLRHLPSPGKSGSVFFLSQDERFFLKTMSRAEMSVLVSLLPAYHRHVERHPHTLLCRFFGLHCVTAPAGRKYRFVVMSNIFRTPLQLHRKYDLKGSTLGRTAGRPPADDPTIVFKDLDLDLKLRLEEGWRDRLLFQLRADCGLLAGSGVMDYSLLVGLHFRGRNNNHNHNNNHNNNHNHNQGQQNGGSGEAEAEAGGGGAPGHNGGGGGAEEAALANEFTRVQERLQRLRPRLGEIATRDLGELVAERIRQLTPGGSRGREGGGLSLTPAGASFAGGGGGGGSHKSLETDRGGGGGGRGAAAAGGGGGGGRTGGRGGGGSGPSEPGSAVGVGSGGGLSVNDELALSCGQSRVQLGVNMAATAVHKDGREEAVVLWFALIDILQPYNTTKKLEHNLKSVVHSANSISVTHPTTYANRFQAFMKRVFE